MLPEVDSEVAASAEAPVGLMPVAGSAAEHVNSVSAEPAQASSQQEDQQSLQHKSATGDVAAGFVGCVCCVLRYSVL